MPYGAESRVRRRIATMLSPEQAVILLAEDRHDDVMLIKRALAKANVRNPVFVVSDGEEALSYLDGAGKYGNRAEYPLPDLMLLDLKMPKVDGFEVLRYLRSQPGFKSLRIIVLTSSEEIFDVNRAYDLGANSFLVKPLEFENFAALMRTMAKFWFQHSTNPSSDRPSGNGRKNGYHVEGHGN
jgi:CheY-like chemotaxis protein